MVVRSTSALKLPRACQATACSRVRLSYARATFLVFASLLAGQDFQTIEQVTSRPGPDFAVAQEGRSVTVRGQVAGAAVWASDTYYLPLRDATEHGLLLRGELRQFGDLAPGDWVEAGGVVESRAGLPLLAVRSIHKAEHGTPPPPKTVTVAELCGFRYLGLPVRTDATITSVGENRGGKILHASDGNSTISIFLPRSGNPAIDDLSRVRIGDRVRFTGLATEYATRPPYDRDFQVMLAAPRDIQVLDSQAMLPPKLLLSALGAIVVLLAVWLIRRRRMRALRSSMRAFHRLCEEIIAAPSPADIAERLVTVLPTITQATGAWLYLFNRRTKSLERVPTAADPQPLAVPVDAAEDGPPNGAAVCFRNRTPLNIPDVRRSPFVRAATTANPPRSVMIAPLTAQNDVLGTLEVGNGRRLGYFTMEEQGAIQHLSNQVAAALKLQEQRTIREQLFRSEKLAATGQLISGVASELRAPLDSILQLATSLGAFHGRPVPERDLRQLAGESQRASEIVSRLVSFARPEDSEERRLDVNALLASLVGFRDPECKALGIRVQNRLSPEPALVLGAQGQIEQVFLNLLIHAEQRASEASAKTLAVTSTVIAGHVLVEISYHTASAREDGESVEDPFADGHAQENTALGLAVCKGVIRGHGGEIHFHASSGRAVFEIDLPLAHAEERPGAMDNGKAARSLTLMLVEPDPGAQRQLLGLLSLRGHRVVPVAPEEAADLAHRIRFDGVLWAMRLTGSKWSEFQTRIRASVPAFVVLSDGYDAELARSLDEGGDFLLGRPIQEGELNRILMKIEARSPSPSPARPGR